MAGHVIPHFQNDGGFRTIAIGVTEFMCCGANPPHDHPHVYIDMGDEGEKICSYCSTLYKLDTSLKPTETRPEGCIYQEDAA